MALDLVNDGDRVSRVLRPLGELKTDLRPEDLVKILDLVVDLPGSESP